MRTVNKSALSESRAEALLTCDKACTKEFNKHMCIWGLVDPVISIKLRINTERRIASVERRFSRCIFSQPRGKSKMLIKLVKVLY